MSDRIFDPTAPEEEEKEEKSLRPETLSQVIGRGREKKSLKVMIEAAKARGEALDHVLFHGPPGLGKTTLAWVLAKEMGVPIYITSGPAIERQGDLASILTNIEQNGILFIDEIHRLNPTVEEILYPAMEDRAIDIIIGKGPSARTMRLDLSAFTVVAATTKISKLSAPLRDRFGVDFRLDYYEDDEMIEIVKQKAELMGTRIENDAAREIALRARMTPRIALRLVKRVRDFADINNDGVISLSEVEACLKLLNIDELGLDYLDRKILDAIILKFNGGPVGLSTLAASVSEEVETLEEVYEPYLLQQGFLQRTPRGRVATKKAFDHLNIPYKLV
ncbi:Holliday junction branch migration DNA helicase RuvB [Candidatus Dojkabacteria bacterium]|nr:Holliday junction branch migration DNA helicase RuvB [Candidatus Dojkabacteria bacterium]